MQTMELKIEMPVVEARFLESYAKEHATTVSALMTHYAKLLQTQPAGSPHPRNAEFSGVVPADLDVRETYRAQIEAKHL